ncbi:MAG TPA: substrate-binding domain-containing protein [Kofleriaceae bacterium]|nr:substrate-binding domain-containing protein [Kofleriaceae bacterium]
MDLAPSRFALVALLVAGGCLGDGPPPPPTAAAEVAPPEADVLRTVGSGAMSPLVARLGARWAERGRSPRVVVEPSVGSRGGVLAAADGVVDFGLVSRPLDAEETRLGLVVVPVARDAVVLAAHPELRVDSIASAELRALYSGDQRLFSDGTPATLLLRDRKESANDALERLLPALRPLREAAYGDHRFRVLYHDNAMGEALAATPGAVGVFSLGVVVTSGLPLRVLAIDGLVPSVAALADGRWRATRELVFVVRPDRLERVRPFLDDLRSAEGQRLITASGYAPIGGAP